MDQAGPQRDLPEQDGDADRGAKCRPEGICAPTFAEVALKLLDQGYEPLPILPGQKRPAVNAWTSVRIDEAQVEAWCRQFGHCGVGLRTGRVVGVDTGLAVCVSGYRAADAAGGTCRGQPGRCGAVASGPVRLGQCSGMRVPT